MTSAQHRVLRAVKGLFSRLGHSPSYTEIAREANLKSLASVHKHIKALADQGYLLYGENSARSLVLIPNALGGFKKCDLNHEAIFFLKGNCPLCVALHLVSSPREVLVNLKLPEKLP